MMYVRSDLKFVRCQKVKYHLHDNGVTTCVLEDGHQFEHVSPEGNVWGGVPKADPEDRQWKRKEEKGDQRRDTQGSDGGGELQTTRPGS